MMSRIEKRWLFVAVLLALLLALFTLSASGVLIGHHFVVGRAGGQLDQNGLKLQSVIGQPVIGGGGSAELILCSGYQGEACSLGGRIYLPVINRTG